MISLFKILLLSKCKAIHANLIKFNIAERIKNHIFFYTFKTLPGQRFLLKNT